VPKGREPESIGRGLRRERNGPRSFATVDEPDRLKPCLVGAAGLALIGVGLWNGYSGIKREFLKDSTTTAHAKRSVSTARCRSS